MPWHVPTDDKSVGYAIIIHTTMLKNFTKAIFILKAVTDLVKEKVDTKAAECAIQLKKFTEKKENDNLNNEQPKSNFKEKTKEELVDLISQVNHKAQISEIQLKGFIKDKLTELTNNALLDSTELNDIRAEIASLHAEIRDIKSQLQFTRR